MRTPLETIFIYLANTIDTRNCGKLRKIMQKFGYPESFTQIGPQVHDEMIVCVTDKWSVSETFRMTNLIKQGCVLRPILSLMFPTMLMDA
ncbi:unnamed protein product [Dibothriocephalus latus]|uniref:Reverse transcriptase domain-containing protein n=1 Tax=Dibothriocephalus latus TaxID=60516 RepID=A0A3P6SXZ6_DIBLA|nr:unnamed protein product [Dibothriocephalus latus]